MRILGILGLMVVVAGLTAVSAPWGQRPPAVSSDRLTFSELENRGLLDESEIWVARNLGKREPEGVLIDLEGNGSRSTVVAGIRTSKIPSSGLEDLTGFVKVYGGGGMPRIDWEFPGHYMSGLRTVKFENGSRRQAMATFADAGSTFGFSLNVFVFATENGPGSVTLPSVEGGLAARDLDGDGREEVIFQSRFEPGRVSPRILWRDVLRWNGFGFVKANERFGAFYRDQIENYYRVNIRKAEGLQHPESYIAGNRRAIEMAEKLASNE